MQHLRQPYFITGLLVALLVAGVAASPARPAQQSATLLERVDLLETAVAEQQQLTDQLEERVAALEQAVGLGSAPPPTPTPTAISTPTASPTPTLTPTPTPATDWPEATSSDQSLSYRYDPTWQLDEDEPGLLSFMLPRSGQFLGFFWDIPPGSAEQLRGDAEMIEEFQQEFYCSVYVYFGGAEAVRQYQVGQRVRISGQVSNIGIIGTLSYFFYDDSAHIEALD